MNFNPDQVLLLLQILVGVLKSIPGISPEVAQWIAVIESGIAGGLTAHRNAQAKVDPGALTPEAPVA